MDEKMHPKETELHLIIQGRDDQRLAPTESPTAPGSAASSHPLPITFDQAYANLEQLPNLFIEPDGAFLWTGWSADGVELWRLDGCLYDGGRHLQYVEIKGRAGLTVWRQFMNACGAGHQSAMLQLVRAGRFVTLEQFYSDTLDS